MWFYVVLPTFCQKVPQDTTHDNNEKGQTKSQKSIWQKCCFFDYLSLNLTTLA